MKRASEAGADALRALDVPGRDRGQGPAPSESGSASPSAAPSESLPPLGSASPSGAAALFAAANQARRRGAHAEALRLYRELQRHHPSSPEAKLSHATMGKLMLDEGDSRAARDAIDRYLENKGGSLSEEALIGRALALQKLGRDAEERAAWQALLRAHPSSLHVPRARARLAELATE
jgi:tetratricopeptide (TPR) repeat protein